MESRDQSRRRRSVAALALGAAMVIGCGGNTEPGAETNGARPNVILVSIDTLRADHLGCYGYPYATSPFLDSLAERGVRFESAFAQSSWTLPSHMSMLTSRYPHSHQVDRDDRELADDVTTLAEALRGGGYETAAIVSWFYVGRRFGFARGFETFDELIPPVELQDSTTQHSVKAARFVDHVIDWSAAAPREPFFLFLHLFDPHVDYEPPLEHARVFDPGVEDVDHGSYLFLRDHIKGLDSNAPRIPADELERVTALYDGEIRYVDRELARLFDVLVTRGLLERTLIVVTSDHGEELDDHGSMEGHQWTLYDEITRVPLLVVPPGQGGRSARVESIVESIDIAPTILDYAGIETPGDFEGRSLRPWIEDAGERQATEFTFSQTRRYNSKWAMRTPRYKLIYTQDTGTNAFGVPVDAGYELYDLHADPGEHDNIFQDSSPVAQELLDRMKAWMSTGKPWRPSETPAITPEERERLRSLGYVSP